MRTIEGGWPAKDFAFRMYQLIQAAVQEDSIIPAQTPRTGIEGGGSKDPVHQSGTHGDEQGSSTTEPSLEEDGCRVIGDHIDTTKLLQEHDEGRGL